MPTVHEGLFGARARMRTRQLETPNTEIENSEVDPCRRQVGVRGRCFAQQSKARLVIPPPERLRPKIGVVEGRGIVVADDASRVRLAKGRVIEIDDGTAVRHYDERVDMLAHRDEAEIVSPRRRDVHHLVTRIESRTACQSDEQHCERQAVADAVMERAARGACEVVGIAQREKPAFAHAIE